MSNILFYILLIIIIVLLAIMNLIRKQINNQEKIIEILSSDTSKTNETKKTKKGPMPSDELEKIKADYMKSGGYKP